MQREEASPESSAHSAPHLLLTRTEPAHFWTNDKKNGIPYF